MSTRTREKTPWPVDDEAAEELDLSSSDYDGSRVIPADDDIRDATEEDDRSRVAAYLRITQQLEQPLDRSLVKTRLKNPKQPKGPNNPLLDYLDWRTVVRTLNRIFGYGHWEMDVKDIKYLGEWEKSGAPKVVVATVALTVTLRDGDERYLDSASYTNVGVGEVHYDSCSGVDMAVKGAIWDGVKRCATALGEQFGITLYDDESPNTEIDSSDEERATTARVSTFKPRTTPPSNGHNDVGESFECEDCGKQVRGYTSKTGKTYTAEDLYNMSVKYAGAGYCYDCKAKHTNSN